MSQENFFDEFYKKAYYSIAPICKQSERSFPIDDKELRKRLPAVIEEIFSEYINSSILTKEQQERIEKVIEHKANAVLFAQLDFGFQCYDWTKLIDECMTEVFSEENTARLVYDHILRLLPDDDIGGFVIQSLRKYPFSKIYKQ